MAIKIQCHHCGDECESKSIHIEQKYFCCQGCKTVYEILNKVEMNIMTEYNQNIFENGAVETRQKSLQPIIVKDVQRIIQNSRTSFDFK